MSEDIIHAVRSRMKVIFDLDGTLANSDHRVHFLSRDRKDWRGFYDACDKDAPCHPLIHTLLALYLSGADVEIWTGRSAEVADKTASWLAGYGIGHIPTRMRPEGDHRPDTELKAEWLSECDVKPSLIFEDRSSVVNMWRSHGIVCAQVAPGDFQQSPPHKHGGNPSADSTLPSKLYNVTTGIRGKADGNIRRAD